MFDIRFAPQSIIDLDEIKLYVADKLCNSQAAQDLIALIFEKIRILSSFPLTGAQIRSKLSFLEGYRFLIIKNYIVFYRTENNVVSVVRVLYARRDYLALLAMDADEK